MSIYAWLHRKGIARVINASSNSLDDRGSAYIEARGPRWIAARLAMYALRRSAWCKPDWQTVRIVQTQRPGRLHWRFSIDFRWL